MNWKDCVHQNEGDGLVTRFEWPLDAYINGFDCNDALTYNDIWGAISWVWTWPGDYLLNLPQVQSFFEMDAGTIVGSWWSTALGWLILFAYIIINETFSD